jgi:two-component system sporulation sensor kinase A
MNNSDTPEPSVPELGKSAFRLALDISPHPVLIHDQDLIVYVNQACATALRAERPEQLIGKPVMSIVDEDGREAGEQRRKMVVQHGHEFTSVPLKLTACDGTTAYAEAHATRIFDSGRPFVLVSATEVRYEG